MLNVKLLVVIINKNDDDNNNNNNSSTKLHVDIFGAIMISAVFNSIVFFGYEK